MIEYEELVSIGIIAVQTLIKGKSEEQLARYNDAYIGTAVKWAIRNELRHRYNGILLNIKKKIQEMTVMFPMLLLHRMGTLMIWDLVYLLQK